MLKVKLTRIESSHNLIRTKEMIGWTGSIPEKGYDIQVFGESLTEGMDFRKIQTSLIQESTYDKETKTFTFKTLNSTYTLEILTKERTDEDIFSHGKYNT